jgi:lipid A 4'-phosphatase
MMRHPWLWTLALLAPLSVVPWIDMGLAGVFYDPVLELFPFRSHPVGEWVRKGMPVWLFGLAIATAVLWAASEVWRRPLLGVSRRIGAFILLSLALGPGVIVNLLLKDFWGRARPSHLVQFGGKSHYTSPLLPTDQCLDNCSFSSGHAALAFWVVSFALLVPPAWRGRAIAAALGFGFAVGMVRVAQGGHFLSDVAYSGAIVTAVACVLHRWLVAGSEGSSPKK